MHKGFQVKTKMRKSAEEFKKLLFFVIVIYI